MSVYLPRPQVDLVFASRGGPTVLDRRRFRWPFVLTRTFALDAVPSHMLTVILQTSAGALHGEDKLSQRFEVRPGAAAHVTTQGASAVHRAPRGLESRDSVALEIAPGGFLEYLPEPRILFPEAALEQTLDIRCAPCGIALVADAFTFHDPAGSGGGPRGLRSTTTLRCGDETLFVDRMEIGGELVSGPTARFRAFGSLVLAMPGAPARAKELSTALAIALAEVPGLYGAASLLPSGAGVGVRLAAPELRGVRSGAHVVWTLTRKALFGLPPPSRRKGGAEATWGVAARKVRHT